MSKNDTAYWIPAEAYSSNHVQSCKATSGYSSSLQDRKNRRGQWERNSAAEGRLLEVFTCLLALLAFPRLSLCSEIAAGSFSGHVAAGRAIRRIYPRSCSSILLHFTLFHSILLHFISLHFTPLHSTSLHFTPLHSTSLHFTPLHSTSLHFTPLHSISLYFTDRPMKRHITIR